MGIRLLQHLLQHPLMLLSSLMHLLGLTRIEVPCTADAIMLSRTRLGLINLHLLILGRRLQVVVDLVVITQVVFGLDGPMKSLIGSLHALASLTASHC